MAIFEFRNYNYLIIVFVCIVFFPKVNFGQSIPCANCTIYASGNNDYVINDGEKICIRHDADFTGTITLTGPRSKLENCSGLLESSQIIMASPAVGILLNYGTLVMDSDWGVNVNSGDDLVFNNFGTIDLQAYTLTIDGSFFSNNGGSILSRTTGGVTILADVFNMSGGSILLEGGELSILNAFTEFNTTRSCIDVYDFENTGTIDGQGEYTDIYMRNYSENRGTIKGKLALIDETPTISGSNPPYFDDYIGFGTIFNAELKLTPQNGECRQEICGNEIDDNRDGRIDEPYPNRQENDLILWLKANVETNTTIDGGDVTVWEDQSKSNFDAVADLQATYHPKYNTNGINYNPSVEFFGPSNLFNEQAYSGGLHLGGNYIDGGDKNGLNIFTVSKKDEDGPYTTGFIYDFGRYRPGQLDGYGFFTAMMSWGESEVGSYHSQAFRLDNYGVHNKTELFTRQLFLAGEDAISLNGNNLFTSTFSPTVSGSNYLSLDHIGEASAYGQETVGPFSIGRASAKEPIYGSQGAVFDGKIAEIMVFDSIMTTQKQHEIESYLAVKYAITLGHNYYDFYGNMIKDVSTHGNEVVGLGREYCIGLYQKQSKSGFLVVGVDDIANTNIENTGIIEEDNSYILFGHNGAATDTWTITETIGQKQYQTNDREWEIDRHNYYQSVVIRIEEITNHYPPMNASEAYHLLFYDRDGNIIGKEILEEYVGYHEANGIVIPHDAAYMRVGMGFACRAKVPTILKIGF